MKVIAVNGSARKNWNTHTLLQNALDGAASKGAETQMVNLYDLTFKGCIGCLGCKRKGGDVGRCVLRDELTPILDAIDECDALILGSPIYLGEVTGEMRKLYERLFFQQISYDAGHKPLPRKKDIKSAFFFTTNCPDTHYDAVGYTTVFKNYEGMMTRMLGKECKILTCSRTLQVEDFDKYHMTMFDVPAVRKRREEVFPLDCKNAFDIGVWSISD